MDLTVGWEENNIFTASFTVSLKDLQQADNVTQKIKEIEDNNYKLPELNKIEDKLNKIIDVGMDYEIEGEIIDEIF